MNQSRRSSEEFQTEIDQVETLRATHRQRLYVLQRQAAEYGRLNTPPHIQMEIVDTDQAISKFNAQLGVLEQERWNFSMDPAALEPVTMVPAMLAERLIALQRDMSQLGYQMRREVAALHKAIADSHEAGVVWRTIERESRIAGQRHNYRWLVAIGILLAITVVTSLIFIVYFITLRLTGAL